MNILNVLTKKRLTGNIGENMAATILKKSGYKILERNYVALGHEIDIIAQDKKYLVFVEVKTRTTGKENTMEERPALAVTKEKMRGIIKTARHYSAPLPPDREIRFDIMEIFLTPQGKLDRYEHLISAFTVDSTKSFK